MEPKMGKALGPTKNGHGAGTGHWVGPEYIRQEIGMLQKLRTRQELDMKLAWGLDWVFG